MSDDDYEYFQYIGQQTRQQEIFDFLKNNLKIDIVEEIKYGFASDHSNVKFFKIELKLKNPTTNQIELISEGTISI